jgi:hypothetical protein
VATRFPRTRPGEPIPFEDVGTYAQGLLTPELEPADPSVDPATGEPTGQYDPARPQAPPIPHDDDLLEGELTGSPSVVMGRDGVDVMARTDIDYQELEKEPDAKEIRAAVAALYGSDFPLLKQLDGFQPTESDWATWAKSVWDRHRSAMQRIIHTAERNRLYRSGDQWVTAVGLGPWKEPPKPKDIVRAVENMVRPALDLRVQLVREQAPGFRTTPTNRDPQTLKKAEAQQHVLEYAYREQDMPEILAEAEFWAGTDGVAFLSPYWHPDEGPWSEGMNPQPLGDVRTCVYRIEQVRVSANASATRKPYYSVIREVIPAAQAVAQHGPKVLDRFSGGGPSSDIADTIANGRYGFGTPTVDELFREQETVDRFTVYCEKSSFLPGGLTLIVVGQTVALQTELLYGRTPIIRLTDGSTDPAYFPQQIMNDWVPHQMRVNALVSKMIESIRVNAGGRFLMKSGATSRETFVGGATSIIEVKGAFTSLSDAIQPVNGFSVGVDVKEAYDREKKAFEDRSGWNDTSRGSFASDQSGRAILAVREQLERVFAPTVGAAAAAMSEWGELVLEIYKVMLEVPRLIAITGKGRSDWARVLTREDFDGVAQVEIDPETLMPMPRSLRLHLLDQLYQTGVIDAQELRERMPFAFVGEIQTPNTAQEARAKRIADAIRNGQPVPEIRWTDDESIHQTVLEREILTQDEDPPPIVQQALERWFQLANQAMQKEGVLAPQMIGAGAPAGPGETPPEGEPLPPDQAPLANQNSGMAAAPMIDPAQQQAAAAGFEATQPQ